MKRDTPKQAFAAREAYEALRDLKKLVDETARMTHAAELESFHSTIYRGPDNNVHRSLRDAIERLNSLDFDRVLFVVREKLETAVCI